MEDPSEVVFDALEPPQVPALVASLIGSSHHRPVSVNVQAVGGPAEGSSFDFVVTALSAVYPPDIMVGGAPASRQEKPDYEFEGWLIRPALEPFQAAIKIQGRLRVGGVGHTDCTIRLQRGVGTDH